MEEKNQSFTELEVWKKARLLKNELKELADRFPPEEKFRLTDQLIRLPVQSMQTFRKGMAVLLIKIKYIFVFRHGVRYLKLTVI